MIEDIIKPGDRIDIKIIQQLEQSQNSSTEPKKTHIYKSKVYDVNENGKLQIAMPTENGKLVLLPLGIRFEFVFYSNGGLYRGEGQVKERYKQDNLYILDVELQSRLMKFQRREFFRHQCTIDMSYFELTPEEAELESAEIAFEKIRDEDFYEKERKGIIVDISGGGVRFTSTEELQNDSYILITVRLSSDKVDKQYYLIGKIITCTKIENVVSRYENRVQFMLKDDKTREEIIRFIFEEERKSRNRY